MITSYLFFSLLWGSIGMGYCVYGKKQQSISAMAGGILMMAAAYFTMSVVLISAICLAIIAVVFVLVKRGY